MHILNFKQVQYSEVIRLDKAKIKLPGVLYQEKLFFRVKTYDKEQLQEAITYGRQKFLARKGLMLFLVIEEEEGVTIWEEDKKLKLVEKKIDVVGTIKLPKLVKIMRKEGGIKIQDRRYYLKIYPRCFVGREAVQWLKCYFNFSTEEALRIGQRLIKEKWIHHVVDEHDFENKYLFYRFYCDE